MRDTTGGQGGARGEKELCFNKIGKGDGFCDCVFDLKAGVYFEEVVLFCCGVDEEFKGSKRKVLNLLTSMKADIKVQ